MENQRNLLLAMVLCLLLLIGWDQAVGWFYPQKDIQAEAEQADAVSPAKVDDTTVTANDEGKRDGGLSDPQDIATENVDLKSSLAQPQRVQIDAPEISGSINLIGARFDDLTLKTHRQRVEKDSGPVRIFSPAGTPAQHFAQFGWVGEGAKVPDARTVWQADGDVLTQDSPLTLSWDNGEGQLFSIRYEVDDHYMITATQAVSNTGDSPVVVKPFGLVNRTSTTASESTFMVHSGPIAHGDDGVEFGYDYDDVAEEGTTQLAGRTDWLGFGDIYWQSAIIPQDGARVEADFRSLGNDLFRADAIYESTTIPAGQQVSHTTRLFAGAKESDVLSEYEDEGITNFNKSIDWGWFDFLAKPIWWLLNELFALVGNFGVAIMLMTLLIRLLLFPIAQKQFSSMAQMRAVQPKMKAIQERYKDDRQKQQQEIMQLYKDEKVNPLAGCLPIVIQIPIFFALYKTLLLSIEMRHQPFALWIKDLSAPDPAHILNLFGLLPFDVPGFLAIGPLAVMLGVTMWLTFRLNPTPMDPIQQQVFAIMPWVLMFVMAPFAAGLLIYWITNNVLTLAQQSYLYSKHPQLRAQAEKDKADKELAAAQDDKVEKAKGET